MKMIAGLILAFKSFQKDKWNNLIDDYALSNPDADMRSLKCLKIMMNSIRIGTISMIIAIISCLMCLGIC